MINKITRLLVLLMFPAIAFSQTGNFSWPEKFFSGYETTIHGGGFLYHSPEPEVTSAMLIRSLVSTDNIEWATEKVPQSYDKKSVYFIWMFGIDVNADSHEFYLHFNGDQLLTFRNPRATSKSPWSIDGTDGSQLVFMPTMIDQFDDLMGYAILKVPASVVKPGEAQRIKITCESAGSAAWYMTFESPVREKMQITQLEAIVKEKGKQYGLAQFGLVHLGGPTTAKVSLANGETKELNVEPGYNSIQFTIPVVDQPREMKASVAMNGRTTKVDFTVKPVRKWTVYFVEHTHTDIGYTRPQNEILAAHLDYIDKALDYCDETDKYPSYAQFHWTCETAWAVREYIRTRPPSQVARLLQRIKEGRIEVTGAFLNMSNLYDEPTLSNLMETIKEFKAKGIPVKTGMQDDVNGASWCLVDYLTSAGVKYFTMGQNTDRAMEPFKMPTAFWWESPSGKKILAYRGEHYMFGDNLGILSGDMNTLGGNLFRYLTSLEAKGFPYDRAQVQFLGYLTDNAPPSTKACDLVREWDSRYEWPKLELSTVSTFFSYIEKKYGSKLSTYRMAWPDWWIDGFGSAEEETAHVRDVQADMIANQGLLAMATLLGEHPSPAIIDHVTTVNEDDAFYDEHTFGAAESISDPLSENSTVQWNEKRAFAWNAFRLNGILQDEAVGLFEPLVPKAEKPTITVFNTMSSARSGVTKAFIYNQILPPEKEFRLVDANGNDVPAQILSSRSEGNYWAIYAKDVPAFGYKTYEIEVGDKPSAQYRTSNFDGKLDNKYYTVTVDTVKGAISGIYDKSLGKELVDAKAPWELGQFIYETLSDREQISRHDLKNYSRTTMSDIKIGKVVDGPLWTSVDITGQVPACADNSGITCEIRLYKTEKRIELAYSMKKLPVTSPEGVYVSFPFDMKGGQISFEVEGGTVVPGKDQLPGSASDWDGVQNFATVRSGEGQIVLVSPQIPIMEFGDINLGKFQEVSTVKNPYIYSWVLNNYWTTNFPASQKGGMDWQYELTSTADSSIGYATKFGWESRVPLVARVSEGGGKKTALASRSLLNFGNGDPLLIYARPAWDGHGIVLCMRETYGRDAVVNLSGLRKSGLVNSVEEVNSLQEPLRKVTSEVKFNPYEVKFIRIN